MVAYVEAIQTQQTETTIGPLFYCDLKIEGVPVTSMVCCRSQMTIISRSLLHQVARKRYGNRLLELKMPTVKLYGKDGLNGVNRLYTRGALRIARAMRAQRDRRLKDQRLNYCAIAAPTIP